MARFFVNKNSKQDNKIVIAGSDAKHISKVLRMKIGEGIDVGCDGQAYSGVITAITADSIIVDLTKELEASPEPPLELYLLMGLPKGEKMDFILEKAVELGVFAIIPVMCHRSVVRLKPEQIAKKTERWQRVAEAAAKQCRRAIIPQVFPACSLENALRLLPEQARILVPWEAENAQSFTAVLNTVPPKQAAVLIGPEGGLEADEVNLVCQYGGVSLSMGPRILRTETAAITALAIMMYQWGDLGGAIHE